MQLTTIKADITTLNVDAIVNAANVSLLGGGGVDGAIHRAAGPALLDECRALNGCPTGQAKITSGYQLPATKVIHTVGPYWHGGQQQEAELLAACYKNSLLLAIEYQLTTIAFPAISTGVYGYPAEQAAKIAIKAVREWSAMHPTAIKEVIFCCYSDQDLAIYEAILNPHIHANNKFRPRSTVIIQRNNSILLVKEKSGDWLLPGGKIEGNETAIAAACREIYEETGVSIKKIESLFEHQSFTTQHSVFLATLSESDNPTIVSEIIDIQWVKPEMLASIKTSPATKAIIEKFKTETCFS
jgi:O-acetyl-ADP-ribose deacetylase